MSTNPGVGKVFTSDASGFGSWQNAGLTLPFAGTASTFTGTGGVLSVIGTGAPGAAGHFQMTSSSGGTTGVLAEVSSSNGVGVTGGALSLNGTTIGVQGLTQSPDGTGVFGNAASTTGAGRGGYFSSLSPSGMGVFGLAASLSGNAIGVNGQSDSENGFGVTGHATSDTGPTFGGSFTSESSGGKGLQGAATSPTGDTTGVYGVSYSESLGKGVFGRSISESGSNIGVYGVSDSTAGFGVFGYASKTEGTIYGVWGEASTASLGYGVFALGDLAASGNKAFRIDDPRDPENRYLMHYCTESPFPQNSYSGNVVTDGEGFGWVTLPEYFDSINANAKYQLTVMGRSFAQAIVYQEIKGNRFQIRTSMPNVKVSWRVECDRDDPHVRRKRPMDVVEKSGRERGTYQDPALYGKAEGFSVTAPLRRKN